MRKDSTRNIAELSPECLEALLALRRITRAIDLHSRSLIQKHGLTSPQDGVHRQRETGNGFQD